jgi:hypothetical protein
MRGKLFRFATAASAVLFVGVAVLWVRSYWRCDSVVWKYGPLRDHAAPTYDVASTNGRIVFTRERYPYGPYIEHAVEFDASERWWHDSLGEDAPAGRVRAFGFEWSDDVDGTRIAPHSYRFVPRYAPLRLRIVNVPWWALAALASALPVRAARRACRAGDAPAPARARRAATIYGRRRSGVRSAEGRRAPLPLPHEPHSDRSMGLHADHDSAGAMGGPELCYGTEYGGSGIRSGCIEPTMGGTPKHAANAPHARRQTAVRLGLRILAHGGAREGFVAQDSSVNVVFRIEAAAVRGRVDRVQWVCENRPSTAPRRATSCPARHVEPIVLASSIENPEVERRAAEVIGPRGFISRCSLTLPWACGSAGRPP